MLPVCEKKCLDSLYDFVIHDFGVVEFKSENGISKIKMADLEGQNG